MSDFILNEEPFSLGILDRVPSPQTGECFLLYREGAGKNDSIVLSSGVKYSSAEIRHGHYNRKVTISLKEQDIVQNMKIAIKDELFCFEVNAHIACVLQDVKEYFFSEKPDKEDIRRLLRNTINEYNGVWGMQESLKAQNSLEENIEKKLRRYGYIRFKIKDVRITPDKSVAEILKSDRDTIVGKRIKQNKTEEEIVIIEEDYKLQQAKMKGMAANMKLFGIMGPVVTEYLGGKMTGTELYEHMMRAKADEMGLLRTAIDKDMLSQDEIIEKVNEILTDTKYIQLDDKPQLTKKNDIMIEEKHSEDIEEDSLEDGDRI